MFGRIAHRYDAANLLLSGGMDSHWRRVLVAAVQRGHPREVLDLATGSGGVAFALGRKLGCATPIIGMDFCQPMLDQALARKAAAGRSRFTNVSFRLGDGLSVPSADETFDAVTIAFGLRNLADRARGLREMRRVLRPGGKLYVLEFSQPHRWLRPLYYFYLAHLLPRLAGMVTGDRAAYVYLNETIAAFPDAEALTAEIANIGFAPVAVRRMTGGIVALHTATKP